MYRETARTYSIGSNRSKLGVKTTYSGKLKLIITAAFSVYVKTWGKVFVKTSKGEYNYGTSVKSSWE